MARWFGGWMGLPGALVVLAAPAHADIQAYNAAVLRGDFAAAAVEAEEVWATYDKSKADVVIVAREFALTSMRAQQATKAAIYAKWLVEEGPRLGVKDDDPVVARVLLAWVQLGDNPKEAARKSLIDALESWSSSNRKAGPVIPATAATELLARDWRDGRLKDVRREAPLVASLSAQLGSSAATFEESAKLIEIAAEFLDEKKLDSYFRLADFHDALMERMGPVQEGKSEEDHPLFFLDMRSHAWMESIVSYFDLGPNESTGKRDWNRVKVRNDALKGRCDGKTCPAKPDPPGATPKCPARWDQSPKLTYPEQAEFRGIVGTVILDITTDGTGAVTDVKVLAAVPSELFTDRTVATVKKWELKRSSTGPSPCTLAGTLRLHAHYRFP